MGDALLPCCPSSLQDLMLKLCSNQIEDARAAAFELRKLTKTSSTNRSCIAQIGAIPRLIELLASPDRDTQIHSVTALFNLSLRNEGNKAAIASTGIDAVLEVLMTGELEARENAAALLCNLSRSDAYMGMMNAEDVFTGLVGVLREGSPRGKRDAASTMYNLLQSRHNRGLAVRAGAVGALLEIAQDREGGLVDESLALLANLAGHHEGRCEMRSTYGLECLLGLVKEGSDSNKEFACTLLLLLCQHSSSVSHTLHALGIIEPLFTVSQCGTDRARRKAIKILELL